MLGADVDDLRDALADVRLRAPDGDRVGHAGAAVDVREPLAQAALGAFAVVVDGEVEALGDGERGGVTVCLLQRLPQDGDVAAEVVDAGGARPHPRVAEAHGAPQRGLDAPAEPHGRTGALHRLRLHADVLQPEELARVGRLALRPEGAHYRQRLRQALHPPPRRDAEGRVVGRVLVADAEARVHAPAAEHVERGQVLRQLHGVVLGQDEHGRPQPHARRDRGHVGEQADRFEVAAAAEHLVQRPQALEPQFLRPPRHPPDGLDVDRLRERDLGKGEPERDLLRHGEPPSGGPGARRGL